MGPLRVLGSGGPLLSIGKGPSRLRVVDLAAGQAQRKSRDNMTSECLERAFTGVISCVNN